MLVLGVFYFKSTIMDTLFGDIFSKVPITTVSRYEFGSNSDLNYLVWGYIRLIIQTDKTNIAQDITLMCTEYVGSFINSSILTGNMNVYLIQLLQSQSIKCSLSRKIFSALRDGFDSNSLYSKFNQHYHATENNTNNTRTKSHSILLIQTKQGNIFGGYTTTKWKVNRSRESRE